MLELGFFQNFYAAVRFHQPNGNITGELEKQKDLAVMLLDIVLIS